MNPDVEKLIDEAEEFEDHASGIPLAEAAVAAADREGTADQRFRARELLIRVATFGGEPAKALPAFAWCLDQCDAEPDRWSDLDMLWEMKWVAGAVEVFPEIPRAQVDATLADMERRYTKNGISLRPYFGLMTDEALQQNDLESAAEWRRRWMTAPRDGFADCRACEMDLDVRQLWRLGDLDGALAAAAPLLAREETCAEVPARTYARLGLIHLDRGQPREALEAHVEGYPLIKNEGGYVDEAAEHIEVLLRTGNVQKALGVFDDFVDEAFKKRHPLDQMEFWSVSAELFGLLPSGAGVRLPNGHPLGSRTDDTAALAAWCEAESDGLIEAFDRRDGSTARRERRELLRRRVADRSDHPLSGGS